MSSSLALLGGVTGIAAAIFLLVVTAGSVRAERNAVDRSLTAIATLGAAATASEDRGSLVQRVLVPALEQFAGLGRAWSPTSVTERLSRQLDLAGNPSAWPLERLLAIKVVGVLGAPVLALWLLSGGGFLQALLFGVGMAAFAFFAPDLLVYNAGTKRQGKIQQTLPDAIDLLTISVEAGLGFDAALNQVARNTNGPLSGEFIRVLQEMHLGKGRSQSFRALGERTTVPELKAFVSAMVQADNLGIPIGRVLREQAKEMRLKRRQRAEEKAMKVPVKILAPMVIFILPVIFVVVLAPAIFVVIRNF